MIIIKRDVFIIELNSASLCIQIRYIRLSKIIFIQNHELLRSLLYRVLVQNVFMIFNSNSLAIQLDGSRYFPTRLRSLFVRFHYLSRVLHSIKPLFLSAMRNSPFRFYDKQQVHLSIRCLLEKKLYDSNWIIITIRK